MEFATATDASEYGDIEETDAWGRMIPEEVWMEVWALGNGRGVHGGEGHGEWQGV